MPSSKKPGQLKSSLELEEDYPLQQKGWLLQNLATFLIFIVILLTALGLFGNGLLSTKKSEANDIVVEYEKFVRNGGEAQLRFSMNRADTITYILFPLSYLDHFRIETIIPQPTSSEVQDGAVLYRFRTKQSTIITFNLSPQQTGSCEALLKVNDTNFSLTHFTYP